MSQLLTTKLYAPPPPTGAVRRARLLERFDAGTRGPLTLLSAPAGFGKTTLVGAWMSESDRPVAWLSLDERDRTAAGFLRYVVAALGDVAADLGDDAAAALETAGAGVPTAALTELVNDLAALERDVVLVLDDYHATDAAEVDEALAFLVEHLPPRLHLVVTTREDPDLPLARLRARGRMTELRAADLRFTPAETAAFLEDVMGLELTPAQVAALEARTEGWITGLQLAALSMRGRDDVDGFVRAFAGDHRYIVDYLVDEVLRRQPEELRDFLLATSLLERLSAPLCEAVTGLPRCDRLLATLERSNLFVVPLDDRRRWYRYHHLFADVLRAHLADERGEAIPELHRRASVWFERDGADEAAVHHAFAAEDYLRASELLERVGPTLRGAYRPAELIDWLRRFPDGWMRDRPGLAVEYARALMDVGELETSDARLRDAEAWFERHGDRDAPGAAPPPSLPALLASARSFHAQASGDVDATIEHARRALELLPETERYERGVVSAVLGLAHWTRGDLETAHDRFAAGLTRMGEAGNRLVAVSATTVLADIRRAQGRLREAERICREGVRRAAELPHPAMAGLPNFHLGLSDLHAERGDADAAARHLELAERIDGPVGPTTRHRLDLARARLEADRGEVDRAAASLEAAARRERRTPVPDVRPIAARIARLRIVQGRLADADAWADAARESGVTVDAEPTYVRAFELLTLARLRIARFRQSRDAAAWNDAATLLGRLRAAQRDEEPSREGLETLVLQALLHEARGATEAAFEPLERALGQAEAEGFVRLFANEGAPMARLLRAAVERGERPGYAQRLLAAIESAAGAGIVRDGVLEPLTPRELEVLGLLADGLSNAQIAARLHRALPTVKGYNRSLYAKLQVERRTEAVARARELGLL